MNYYFESVLEYLTPRDCIKIISKRPDNKKIKIAYLKYLINHYNNIKINKNKVKNCLNLIYCFTPLPTKFRVFHLIGLKNHTVSNILDKYFYEGDVTGSDRIITGDKIVPYYKYSPIPFTYSYLKPNNERFLGLSYKYYFEVTIDEETHRDSWEDECISIGFGPKNSNLTFIEKQVGWSYQTIGYHSDDGHIYDGGNSKKEHFSPYSWSSGDTVGAGIKYIGKDKIKYFFTKNGKEIFVSNERKIRNEIVPLLGIDSSHYVIVNFGEKPFKYDLNPESDNLDDNVIITTNILLDLGFNSSKIDFIPPIIKVNKIKTPHIKITKAKFSNINNEEESMSQDIPYSPINQFNFQIQNMPQNQSQLLQYFTPNIVDIINQSQNPSQDWDESFDTSGWESNGNQDW